ncbi:MAG: lipocalin family protein [Lentisphaeria bacterium]|nr:lipocalin family protein [Lentisphaeria bacterium]
MSKFFVLLFAAAVAAVSGCVNDSSMDIPAVTNFDVRKYMGKWYEIARLPNSFEKGMSQVTAEYTLKSDGKVKVVNCGIKNSVRTCVTGVAEFADSSGTGELKVSFFRPFYSRYRIIKLAADYSYAVVTGSDKKYLWILAREKHLPNDVLQKLLDYLNDNKYPVEKLIYPQLKP